MLLWQGLLASLPSLPPFSSLSHARDGSRSVSSRGAPQPTERSSSRFPVFPRKGGWNSPSVSHGSKAKFYRWTAALQAKEGCC